MENKSLGINTVDGEYETKLTHIFDRQDGEILIQGVGKTKHEADADALAQYANVLKYETKPAFTWKKWAFIILAMIGFIFIGIMIARPGIQVVAMPSVMQIAPEREYPVLVCEEMKAAGSMIEGDIDCFETKVPDYETDI